MTWGDAATAMTTLGSAAGATLAFRVGTELRVAVVVKATFVLAPDAAMVLVDPDPILRADQPRDRSPNASLAAASELVPYRPRADVLLFGHARTPRDRPTPAMGVRLMVARGAEVVLDKRLVVRGMPDPSGRTREPTPFEAMLLAWELSAGGPDNPVGIQEGPRAWPHIVDPRQRDRPAGFGPVSPRWAPRRRLLRTDESAFAARIPAVPLDFPWAYFNAAPEDQRLDFFRGDEWIGFEGMNSQLLRVQSCLPGVVGRARVYGPTPQLVNGPAVPLEADTVTIDTDRLRCSVVWRGSFPVAGAREEDLAALQVFAGVETAAAPLAFPDAYRPEARTAAPAPRAPAAEETVTREIAPPRAAAPVTLDADPKKVGTMALDLSSLNLGAATPFGPSSEPPRPASARPLPAATPFERARLAAPPAPLAADSTMDLSALLDGGFASTMPVDPRPRTEPGSALPFAASRPPADAGATLDVGALVAGAALPFGAARDQPPAPPPPPRPPAPNAARAGSTTALPVMAAGATVDVSEVLLGSPLPFQQASPPPVELWAPSLASLPEPIPPAPPTFAPLAAPPLAPLVEATPPLPDEPEGDAPKTLGAHFLAAMARARRLQAARAA